MSNLMVATLFRMKKSAGVRIAYLITTLAAVLYFICAYSIHTGSIAATQAGTITALGDPMIIFLFGSLMTGLLIGSDFENKTIHGAINCGRKRILVNYVLTYSVMILALTLPYFICSLVCVIAKVNMSGAETAAASVYLSNVLHSTEEYSIGKLILSYISFAIVYVGQLSVCLPVAITTKKPIVVTAFGFFFGMITALLATVFSKVEVLDRLYKLTPYAYTIEKININGSYSDLLLGILVSIIFTGIMGLLSWLLFRHAEIK